MAAVSGTDPNQSIIDAQNRTMAFSALSITVNENINRVGAMATTAKGASDATLDVAKNASHTMGHAFKSN